MKIETLGVIRETGEVCDYGDATGVGRGVEAVGDFEDGVPKGGVPQKIEIRREGEIE